LLLIAALVGASMGVVALSIVIRRRLVSPLAGTIIEACLAFVLLGFALWESSEDVPVIICSLILLVPALSLGLLVGISLSGAKSPEDDRRDEQR
jgi:uncharacterized membrane protein